MKAKRCPICGQHFIGDNIVCVNCAAGDPDQEKEVAGSSDLDKEILISALRNELLNKNIVIQRLMNVLVEKQDKILELEEQPGRFPEDKD